MLCMVETTKHPNEIAKQLQDTRVDIIDLMLLTEAHVALTGDTRSLSALESAYEHVKDAMSDIDEFGESL